MKTTGELTQNSNLQTEGGRQGTVGTKLSTALWRLKRVGRSALGSLPLLVSLSVTGLLLFGRQIRLFEPLELKTFDQMMQLRPALPPDSRLLVVKVTEADIESQKQNGWPLTDAVINQLFNKLEQYQPAVIGLDIYRDIPQEPGHAKLSAHLQKSDRIIPVCKISDRENPGTPGPPNVPESRVGFADIPVDLDGIVRRGLLFLYPDATSRCTTQSSFSFQLAQHYLKKQKGIEPELIKQAQQEYLKIGTVLFKPLMPTDGGYQQADNGGYQILLNYRSGDSLARSVTLTQVLNNQIDPSWVKDRIVLIGVTAPSIDDACTLPSALVSDTSRKCRELKCMVNS